MYRGWLYHFIIFAIFLDALFRCYLLVIILETKFNSGINLQLYLT